MRAADLSQSAPAGVQVILRRRTADRPRRVWIGVGVIVGATLELLNERILLALGERGVHTLKRALQLRHLRWSVGDLVDAYRPAAARPQLDRDARILMDNDPGMRLLGANFKNAVLEVAVVNRAVIKEPEVGARRLQVVNETQRQRAEGEAANTDRLGVALNAADRSVDDKAAGGVAASHEGKDTFDDPEKSRTPSGFEAERFIERERRVGREFKLGAVSKQDGNAAVDAGLDDVAAENKGARMSGCRITARPGDAHLAVGAVNSPHDRRARSGTGTTVAIKLSAAADGNIRPIAALFRRPVGHSELRAALVERDRITTP